MKRILVVDDEEGYCRHLQQALAESGYTVQIAHNGSEALKIDARLLDVLVTDWRLGVGPDGLDVARQMQSINPQLRVVIMTGYSAHDMNPELAVLKTLKILEKPFSLTDLAQALQ
ncbi:MAG: response regulator [Pirellulales bacterium]|nr:response regulator [Pirellulales bacterium]